MSFPTAGLPLDVGPVRPPRAPEGVVLPFLASTWHDPAAFAILADQLVECGLVPDTHHDYESPDTHHDYESPDTHHDYESHVDARDRALYERECDVREWILAHTQCGRFTLRVRGRWPNVAFSVHRLTGAGPHDTIGERVEYVAGVVRQPRLLRATPVGGPACKHQRPMLQCGFCHQLPLRRGMAFLQQLRNTVRA